MILEDILQKEKLCETYIDEQGIVRYVITKPIISMQYVLYEIKNNDLHKIDTANNPNEFQFYKKIQDQWTKKLEKEQ